MRERPAPRAARHAMTGAGATAIHRRRRRACHPVVRLKAPRAGETTLEDSVQGPVTVANDQLDDMVLLRADGTPTYMLAVVVDDHDMGVSHVIRGDDHLTNAFRQTQLFEALDWEPPARIRPYPAYSRFRWRQAVQTPRRARCRSLSQSGLPARGVAQLPAALGLGARRRRSDLDRTGDRLGSTSTASGRSPARFDFAKLDNLNGHYIRESADADLAGLVAARLEAETGTSP